MSKPFDATLKDLAAVYPAEFHAELAGPINLPVQLENVDLSTVTTSTDVILTVGQPLEEVVVFDCQANASADLPRDTMAYNALAHRRFGVPVRTIVVLLRPQADHYTLTGTVSYRSRNGRSKMEFEYEIVRLWERPAESLISGSLGMLPLAPLGQLPERDSLEERLRLVLERVVERLTREVSGEQVSRLLTATLVLTGLRVSREQAKTIFLGVRAVQESVSIQALLDMGEERGELKGIHRVLLRQGQKRFGEPDEATRQTLKEIQDLERLDRLTERIIDVDSWQELLQTP